MTDILSRIKSWFKSVKWWKWALIALYSLAIFWFARSVGDVAFCFVVYIAVVFVVNKIKADSV